MDAREFYLRHGRGPVLNKVLEDAGTSLAYFLHFVYRRKRPGTDLARRLVEATGGELDLDSLLTPRSRLRPCGSPHELVLRARPDSPAAAAPRGRARKRQ